MTDLIPNLVVRAIETPIRATWSAIAADAETDDPEEQMELVIDAGRLTMQGHPDADTIVRDLVRQHGYGTILQELARRIPL